MAIRYLKIVLVVFIAWLGLLYGIRNIVNLSIAYDDVANVAGVLENELYPASLGFPIRQPALTWIIILFGLSSGVVSTKGAYFQVWQTQLGDAR